MDILSISPAQLAEYARVSIGFEVRTIFDLELPENGLGGILLPERPVAPYRKDYDLLGSPLTWPEEFDLKNWGLFLAREGETPLGGAAVAWNTHGVHLLEGRADLAVLWDLRVSPEARGRGVGKALFWHAAAWARERGCRQLKIETQNINVHACRFYAAQGAILGDLRRFAYADDPRVANEVQLNWYLAL